MKLKKLVMTAFGPYAKRQEINFEENLDEKRIFLITGNTGAGKTTIFDGINFALYGEASGSERDGKSLRSDYATLDTKTEVELHFSIRNKNFIVKRSPQYFRKKKSGEGFTESKPTAELIIEKYLDNEGKVITGSKEVTRNVEEILGINSEQFKQLVMIPQGEFKKLLNSDSDKKEEIFRKIFGTKIFSETQDRIKNEANSLKRNVEDIQIERLGLLRNFAFREDSKDLSLLFEKNLNIEDVLERLNNEINKDQVEYEEVKKDFNLKKEEAVLKKQELLNIEENNNIVNTFKTFEKKLLSLDELKETYREKNEKAKVGRKALAILPLEESYKNRLKAEEKNKLDLKEKVKLLEDLELEKKSAKLKLEISEKREAEKIELTNNLKEIESLKSKVKIYEEEREKALVLNKSKEIKANELKLISSEIEKNIALKLSLEEEIKLISEKKNEKNSLILIENKLDLEIQKIKTLIEEVSKYLTQKNRHLKGSTYYEKEDLIYNEENSKLEVMEDGYRRNQAGLLASNLKDGEECPVCGSPHHPKKADSTVNGDLIKEEDIKNQKEKVKKIQERRQKYFEELVAIKSSMDSILENIISPISKEIFEKDLKVEELETLAKEKLQSKSKEGLILKEKLAFLEKEIRREENLVKNKETLEKKDVDLRNKVESINKEILFISEDYKVIETNIKNIKEQFKGKIVTLEELYLKEKEAMEIIEDINKSLTLARRAFEDVSSKFNKNKGEIKALEDRKIELEKEILLDKENLKKKLEEEKLTYKEYEAGQLSINEIKNLEKEVEEFKEEYVNISAGYKQSKKNSEGRTLINDLEIKLQLEKIKEEEELLAKEELNLNSRILRNKDIIKNCLLLNKKIEKDEEKYKVIGRLSKIINGDNKKKLSYERYVLAAYFEDIIYAANLRFSRMTNNRFTLLRKDEVGDKRKGQGLDLLVHDIHTSTSRDVKSLSGGESFKASLSLALGLADVVQSRAGGIQLDTMFIDEGFGSLDPGSLENAIDCLVSLQDDGRTVGIISHVEELKLRIESKIIIEATKEGSLIKIAK